MGIDPRTGARRVGVSVGIAVLIAALTVPAAGAAFTTERVSVSSAGVQANDESSNPDISATGKFVAYDSKGSNLVPSDTNGSARDVFVRNRAAGVTSLVSKKRNGGKGNGPSHDPSISGNGRWVAFYSEATNFIRGGDKNGATTDVFVKDRKTGRLQLVSKRSNGKQGNGTSTHPTISKDGRFVAFESDATNLVFKDVNGHRDVFLHDRQTGKTILVSRSSKGVRGNGDSEDGFVSPDGQFVAYESEASNLIASDPNGLSDVFLFDRITKKNILISRGSRGNGDSDNGVPSAGATWVYFESEATNLDPPDTNGEDDIFRRAPRRGITKLVSRNTAGVPGNGGDDGGEYPDVSDSGRFFVWDDESTNLGPKDGANTEEDVFWRNMKSGITKLVSKSTAGAPGNNESIFPAVSANGKFVAYQSQATNLVTAADSNGDADIFVSGPMRR